jgi:hypothetical protein
MMPGDNMATPVMTMVEASSGNPLDVGEQSSIPFNKWQPKGPSHSTGPHEQVLWKVFNLEKMKADVKLTRGGQEPSRRMTLAMTSFARGPWMGPPWTM